jgi:hypothetical protein
MEMLAIVSYVPNRAVPSFAGSRWCRTTHQTAMGLMTKH